MRISTNQIFQSGVSSILSQQQKLMKLQQQASTGLKVQTPADDPIAAAQIDLMNKRISSTQSLQNNSKTIMNTLAMEDDALTGATNALLRLKTIQVQAGNSALSDADRKSLAIEAQGLLSQLVDSANSKDLNGNYMFSGGKSTVPAVTLDASGNYIYNGDSTQRFQLVSDDLSVAVN